MATLLTACDNDGDKTVKVVEETPHSPFIQIGEQVVVNDVAKFSIINNTLGKESIPTNSEQGSRLHSDNYLLLDTWLSLENISTVDKSADQFFSDIKYVHDNRFEYGVDGVSIEKFKGTQFDDNLERIIEPSQTEVFHFTSIVPAELENDQKPLKLIFTLDGQQYEQQIR
ncbi:hypothetical protein ACIQXF_21240 [Lysinibacillus sp. NPDC097231]|uniref:hypothetical protein n=1 Tax=Lysinibacillus sp. NPDC097231 TaxID=3364142 RepID=UPI003817CA4A